MWMPAAQGGGDELGVGRAGMGPGGGETWSPLTPCYSSDSMYSTASPEPRCPSGGCYRNPPPPPRRSHLDGRQESIVFKFFQVVAFIIKVFYKRFLPQRILLLNYSTPHPVYVVYSWACVSMCLPVCVPQCITSPGPPPTPISGLVCVSPGASWVTDVCYPTPSELAQCDSQCQRRGGGGVQPQACLPQGVGGGGGGVSGMGGGPYQACTGPQSLTWHSLAEQQTAQRRDLWEEISAASGVLALIGCQDSCTPREEMNECARQSTVPA